MPIHDRVQATYEYHADTFLVRSKQYSPQYCHIYSKRVAVMRTVLMKNARLKWGDGVPVIGRIIDSETADDNVLECVLIGALYKHMSLRSSIVDEIKTGYNLSGGSVMSLENYVSENDQLYLEDESGRILLTGSLVNDLVGKVVTGIIVAIKGRCSKQGEFEVQDLEFSLDSHMDVQSTSDSVQPIEEARNALNGDDSYLLIVSGFELGNSLDSEIRADDSGYLLACQLLVNFVNGNIGDEKDVKLASKIARVIVAGNSVAPMVTHNHSKEKHRAAVNDVHSNLQTFDVLLSGLLSTCPVDVLPGLFDPANQLLPQQPLHPCLLPNASRFSSLQLASNPYSSKLDGRNIIGHAGQPTHDIVLQVMNEITGAENPWLYALSQTLKWGHLAPTAPDTLPCYPLVENDPFILNTDPQKLPHVLFAGNQPAFACSTQFSNLGGDNMHETLVVSVPSFRVTRQAVLVNLKTLKCSLLSFQGGDVSADAIKARAGIINKREVGQRSMHIDYNDTQEEGEGI